MRFGPVVRGMARYGFWAPQKVSRSPLGMSRLPGYEFSDVPLTCANVLKNLENSTERILKVDTQGAWMVYHWAGEPVGFVDDNALLMQLRRLENDGWGNVQWSDDNVFIVNEYGATLVATLIA